jgi:hypothetical protein
VATLGIGAAAAALSTAAALRLDQAGTVPPWLWAAYRTALAVVVVCQDRRR